MLMCIWVVSLVWPIGRSHAQTLIDLRIEGPDAVLEDAMTDYVAIATFSDGDEFEVTLFCDWSVEPDDYATIDQSGELLTQDVSDDQQVTLQAVFTWDDVTETATLDVTIVDITEDEGADPWPEDQRTRNRLGRTSSIGPQTPRIAWSIEINSGSADVYIGSTIMAADGRLFVPLSNGSGIDRGVLCVDTVSRRILWRFLIDVGAVLYPPSLYQQKLTFGSLDTLYCIDTATGQEIWSETGLLNPGHGQVVDDSLPGGTVYFLTSDGILHARAVEDGSEVWTVSTCDSPHTRPSLDLLGRVIVGCNGQAVAQAHDIDDGSVLWTGPPDQNFGVLPVENGRVYAASAGSGELYCLDAFTGDVIWIADGVASSQGSLALGHDGTIYVAEGTSAGDLVAVSADGDILWEYEADQVIYEPPIVTGDGTIYFCGLFGEPSTARVHAVRPDGTALWVHEMPSFVYASPMLAPDGTLYVLCGDHRLYAFKDPAKGDVSLNDIIDGRDIRFFIQVLFGGDDDPIRTFAADMNSDGVVDEADVPLFVNALLASTI